MRALAIAGFTNLGYKIHAWQFSPIDDNMDGKTVSPFNDLDQSYEFTINDPNDRLLLGIDQIGDSGVMFRAGLRLTSSQLTDKSLARVFATDPLLTLKVVVGIHWQALRLWIKGGKFHQRPQPPAHNITHVLKSAA